ncbi:MAG: pyridoxamine 5'-phosphate oxidase family protein [Catenulispora sp.]|nr:pyridoxamine 5'-phosphate oxidase family protein [Catenulispora sp.]
MTQAPATLNQTPATETEADIPTSTSTSPSTSTSISTSTSTSGTAPVPDAETEACPHGHRASTGAYDQTPRSTATRYQSRVSYDRAAVHAVLDEALVCHLAFILDGAPVVLPTVHARHGDRLYVHGSTGSRIASLDGQRIGVTVTLLDGLVLGRSWMHHSMAFRSVVVHGVARVVADADERLEAMRALIEHIAPGRSTESREPTRKELAATAILGVDLEEVSLKARGEHVSDDEFDLALPYWAGAIPLTLTAGEAKADPVLSADVEMPEYARRYARPAGCGYGH